MDLTTLPIARYQFQFKVITEINLPEYAGSALRGAFGRSLRKISCMTKEPECKSCGLYQTCPYTNIFETPAPKQHQIQQFSQVPNAYIIEPPEWGAKQYYQNDLFQFDLVLFGKALLQLPLISFAFKRALEYNLAGGKAELMDIQHYQQDNALISILHKGNIIDHNQQIIIPDQFPPHFDLLFITPLRLQENGKPLTVTKITLERFLKTLLKRIALLSEFHHQPLGLDFEQLITAIPQITDTKNLKWQDWTRYSSRQQQKMKLGGIVGQWQMENVPMEWAKLLYIGQWLHCGKNATFGLGKYQITNL